MSVQLKTVIGMSPYSTRWHVALRTYPAEMDTACGKRLAASRFEAHGGEYFWRAKLFCNECQLEPRPTPRPPRES